MSGQAVQAARIAMQAKTFYTTTLKNWVTPWTNETRRVFVPLNDYTATVIGMVRDDVPYQQVLSGDILYVGGSGLPAYSPANNDLYQQMEDQDVDLSSTSVLVASTQSAHTGLPAPATAGVMTTRAAAQAFFVAGTNRAMFRFTMMNHMCKDMEQVHDVNLPPDRIRQDVSRSPGGDSRLFLNNCIGCHSGMDPLAQAFAYYNFDETTGRMRVHGRSGAAEVPHQPGQLQARLRHQERRLGQLLAPGRQHRAGLGQFLPGRGTWRQVHGHRAGAQRPVRALRRWRRSSRRCACIRRSMRADRTKVNDIITVFRSGGYKMKDVFAETAAYCKGN